MTQQYVLVIKNLDARTLDFLSETADELPGVTMQSFKQDQYIDGHDMSGGT